MFSNSINLVSIVFTEVPQEVPMHYRPYQSKLSHETIRHLQEATQGGNNVSTEVFSNLSGHIIAPSSQSMGAIQLPYGWDQKRYSVVIVFEVTTPFGTQQEIISGFTGYNGIGQNGSLDPDMMLYLNSHTIAKAKTYGDNGVRRIGYSSAGSKQILTDVHYVGTDIDAYGNMVKAASVASTPLRPTDTFTYQQRANLGLGDAEVMDSRSMLHGGYTPSSRDNVIGSRYISKICQGYKSAIANNPGSVDDRVLIYGAAADAPIVMEQSINGSMLFKRIVDSTNFGATKTVLISELAGVWPQVHDERIKHVIHMRPELPVSLVSSNQHWGGVSIETTVAYLLIQALPALMGELLFSTYSFTLSNQTTLTGDVAITTTGATFMVALMDEVKRIQTIEASVQTDLANQIFAAGVGDFTVHMQCNSIGSNSVSVAVNGGQFVPFSSPSYCDSTFTPVMGAGSNSVTSIGVDVGYMLSGIFDANLPY